MAWGDIAMREIKQKLWSQSKRKNLPDSIKRAMQTYSLILLEPPTDWRLFPKYKPRRYPPYTIKTVFQGKNHEGVVAETQWASKVASSLTRFYNTEQRIRVARKIFGTIGTRRFASGPVIIIIKKEESKGNKCGPAYMKYKKNLSK